MAKQALREIIEIDEALCDGCGLCIPNCEEGALVIVDGKARLVQDARCDGAGACLGHCPQGALRIIERKAEQFDERYAPVEPLPAAPASAIPVIVSNAAPDIVQLGSKVHGGGCPGSRAMQWKGSAVAPKRSQEQDRQPSALRQWPVQLHLLSPGAAFLKGRELLLAADCVAFALGGFHETFLEGRALAIACPKLDDPSGYEEKLVRILADCQVPALRVAIMEVPCCGGLVRLAQQAVQRAGYDGEVEVIVVSRYGEITERRILSSARKKVVEAGV